MLLPFFNKKKNRKGLIGVDFQPGRIAIAHIIHAEKSGDKPRLKQCAYEAFPENSADVSHGISEALIKVSHSFPVTQFFCNLANANNGYELLLIDTPSVETSELKQAVRWRIKDQLPYHIDDAVIDVFEIPGQQSTRAKLIYVVAAQRQDIEQQIAVLKQAGMEIQFIDIYELAQRNVAAILPEDKDGLVILRLSENSGLVTITRNGTLYLTRKIDFDYERLTRALNDSRATDDDIELSLDELDNIDQQVDRDGFNDSSADINSESIDSENNDSVLNDQSKMIIDEVILEIQRSLDYYVSHFNQRPVSKIYFAPVAKDVPGAIEYISEMLGIKTEVLDFNQYLQVSKPLSKEIQARCFDAIGLALRQEVVLG